VKVGYCWLVSSDVLQRSSGVEITKAVLLIAEKLILNENLIANTNTHFAFSEVAFVECHFKVRIRGGASSMVDRSQGLLAMTVVA
jgi:hypothetical protein